MDASDTIIYVSKKAQTVPGHGKATPVGVPCVRPQSDMRCYRLDRCDLESGSRQFRQHDGVVTMMMFHRRRASPKLRNGIIEV